MQALIVDEQDLHTKSMTLSHKYLSTENPPVFARERI
jgi:hypothetical protein